MGSIMIDDVVIKPMTREFILWRCLHGGPITRETAFRFCSGLK